MLGLARIVLGGLLFAQAALAFAACILSPHTPAQAFSVPDSRPCCAEDEAPAGIAGNANLCLAHCTSDAQRVDTAGLDVPVFSAGPVLVVPRAPVPARLALRPAASVGYAFAAPPRNLLFQNLRI